jgi:hypothetical protein
MGFSVWGFRLVLSGPHISLRGPIGLIFHELFKLM